jgi:iron complex transport system permease protein
MAALRPRLALYLIYSIPFPLLIISLLLGPADTVSAKEVLAWLSGPWFSQAISGTPGDDLVRTIIWDVRLPRVILAFLVGAALSGSGTALQAFFRNPLVDPYLLGLSSGSAFGAALALTTSWMPLQFSAFSFGMIAVGASYFLARTRKSVTVLSLILSGIIVSGIFTSLLTIVQFLTDPFRLQTIVHWTMGNLHNASWAKLNSSAPGILAGLCWLLLFRWRMNVLALGDEETRAVGLNPEHQKLLVLIPATLTASASVAVAGVIGLVGLVVPHMTRMLIGPDNTRTMPASLVLGGFFLLLVDDCSRVAASFEVPIGIFTTLIGGPFFIFLLRRSRVGWEI